MYAPSNLRYSEGGGRIMLEEEEDAQMAQELSLPKENTEYGSVGGGCFPESLTLRCQLPYSQIFSILDLLAHREQLQAIQKRCT